MARRTAPRSSPATVRAVEAAVSAQRSRADDYRARAFALLRQLAPQMLTHDVLDAVAAGDTAAMRLAVRMPPSKLALPLLRAVQLEGWRSGVDEGAEDLAKVLRDAPGGRAFAEAVPAARAAVLRARAAREAAFAATAGEARQAREQARQLMRSFTAHMRDQVAEEMAGARAKGGDAFLDAKKVVEKLRANDPKSKLLDGLSKRTRDVIATPLLEVDWETARRGELTTWQAVEVETRLLVEFGAVTDDELTPGCAWCEGNTLLHGDPRANDMNPALHYQCRSRLVVFSGDDEPTWDKRQTKFIGEPKAGAAGSSYTGTPSQLRVPGSAPNNPPPARLAEWMGAPSKPYVPPRAKARK